MLDFLLLVKCKSLYHNIQLWVDIYRCSRRIDESIGGQEVRLFVTFRSSLYPVCQLILFFPSHQISGFLLFIS